MRKVLTLGESLLRLSTNIGQRLENTPLLDVAIGGAESNVAVNLAQLDHDVCYATKLPQHALGQRVLRYLKAYDVDCRHILLGDGRLGTYYYEPGNGIRAGQVVYDRAYSAMALMSDLEWDLTQLFEGVEILHITGTTLALSPFWHDAGVRLIQAAHAKGVKVSFDMNYRAKLWDVVTAKHIYQQVLPWVDYLSVGYLDLIHFFDISIASHRDVAMGVAQLGERYPQLEVIYGTKRQLMAANQYHLIGFFYDVRQQHYVESSIYELNQVVDRIGAGDSYAAGVLDGILLAKAPRDIVAFATALSAHKHTVFGDANACYREEIEQVILHKMQIQR